MKVAKIFSMLLLILAGIFFLIYGCGGTLPQIEYHGLKARDIPIGLALIAFAIALGRFWKIETETTTKTVIKNGILTLTKTITVKNKSLMRRPWE